MIRYLVAAGICGGFLLIADPLSAHHIDSSCPEDPTLNHFIDTADIAFWSSRFGEPATGVEYLDLAPEPLGNGYLDTADMALVTARFGQSCFGGTTEYPEPASAIPPDDVTVFGCVSKMSVYQYVEHAGGIVITDWGGSFGCYAEPANGPYVPQCLFQFKQNGKIVATTYLEYGYSMEGNKVVCYAEGWQYLLPCEVTVGWAWVGVHRYSQSGPFVFGPREDYLVGSGGFGFNPCR